MVSRCSDGVLVEFAYVSSVEAGLPPAALARLERQCWAHNMRSGITGEMRLEDGVISQTVEGHWSEVMSLASRILTDTRHTSISIRSFKPIEQRRYASWKTFGLNLQDASEVIAGADLTNVRRLPSSVALAETHVAAPDAGQVQRGG